MKGENLTSEWLMCLICSGNKPLKYTRYAWVSFFLCNCMAGALHSLGQLGLGDSRNWLINQICILQVSFVFTNQVDGKLVPMESVERSATHEPNEVAATGEKGVGKINSPSKPGRQSLLGKNLKMTGFNLKNSSLKYPIKSRTTSPNCLLGLKKNPSLDHQPQTKRLHVASDNSDDDFV
jgi:hypothetical protein